MHAMSDIWTAQLAFLAFVFIAICAFGVILLEMVISSVLQGYVKRKPAPSKGEVTSARRPSRR
ncbi:MAG TPA: hypothetical protein VN694_10780 [Caulobacteraceae bacterium]|nr:hypothetical protein [Caulobacteraceae bacterium]